MASPTKGISIDRFQDEIEMIITQSTVEELLNLAASLEIEISDSRSRRAIIRKIQCTLDSMSEEDDELLKTLVKLAENMPLVSRKRVVSFLESGANTSISGVDEERLKATEELEETPYFREDDVPQTTEKDKRRNLSGDDRVLLENTDNEESDVFPDYRVSTTPFFSRESMRDAKKISELSDRSRAIFRAGQGEEENPSTADVFGEDANKLRREQERLSAIASGRSFTPMTDDRLAGKFSRTGSRRKENTDRVEGSLGEKNKIREDYSRMRATVASGSSYSTMIDDEHQQTYDFSGVGKFNRRDTLFGGAIKKDLLDSHFSSDPYKGMKSSQHANERILKERLDRDYASGYRGDRFEERECRRRNAGYSYAPREEREYSTGADDGRRDPFDSSFHDIREEPSRKRVSFNKEREENMRDTLEILKHMGLANSQTSAFRREFKIQGNISGKLETRLTYLSLCSQISEGRKRGYNDDEIAFGVRRAVSTGTELRTYLDSVPLLSLEDTLSYIRSAYQEKSATELFQELGKLCQKEGESGQEFLFRALSLRQSVLMASSAEQEISYEADLVHAIFSHTLRTGFTNTAIRNHMLKFLEKGTKVSDGVLISEMNKVSSEEQERVKKQQGGRPAKKVQFQVNEIKTKENAMDNSVLLDTIHNLSKEMKSLQTQFQELRERPKEHKNDSWKRPTCVACYQAGVKCNHCVKCGKVGHIGKDCNAPGPLNQ